MPWVLFRIMTILGIFGLRAAVEAAAETGKELIFSCLSDATKAEKAEVGKKNGVLARIYAAFCLSVFGTAADHVRGAPKHLAGLIFYMNVTQRYLQIC